MNIALITDTHFNFKKANKSFHDYFLKFYDQIFFPKLIERNIKTVIHLGDTFDNRKGVDYWALKWAKEHVYDRFLELGITVYNIVGNHDAYYKNTNEVNAVDTLLNEYENVIKISNVLEESIDNLNIIFVPWICSDNQEHIFKVIKKTKAKVLFGHLELSGFLTYPGHVQEDGLSKELFKKFDKVFSGHYHTRSNDGKIFYIGNPYQMFWNDVNDDRGFSIFDTNTLSLEFFKNPFYIFEKFYYDNTDIENTDFSIFSDKMVKLIVKNKKDQLQFDNFVERLVKSNCLDLKILEMNEIYDENIDFYDESMEDTLTILNKYVEESQITLNQNVVKKILKEIYTEALELQ
jgi:DNA repair exonuclease SbcCD nuclease subunit